MSIKARDREEDRDQEWGWVRGSREQEECIGYVNVSELLKVIYILRHLPNTFTSPFGF